MVGKGSPLLPRPGCSGLSLWHLLVFVKADVCHPHEQITGAQSRGVLCGLQPGLLWATISVHLDCASQLVRLLKPSSPSAGARSGVCLPCQLQNNVWERRMETSVGTPRPVSAGSAPEGRGGSVLLPQV